VAAESVAVVVLRELPAVAAESVAAPALRELPAVAAESVAVVVLRELPAVAAESVAAVLLREPAAEQVLRIESPLPSQQRDCQASGRAVPHRLASPATKTNRDKAVDYRP